MKKPLTGAGAPRTGAKNPLTPKRAPAALANRKRSGASDAPRRKERALRRQNAIRMACGGSFAALEEAEQPGVLTKADKEVALDRLNIPFTQIYNPFTEFKEATKMKYLSYWASPLLFMKTNPRLGRRLRT
jgi:hypothetical protein